MFPVCCYLLRLVPEADVMVHVGHEERSVRHVQPEPSELLQLGHCSRAACKEKGCEVEISHRAVQDLE